MDDTELFAGPNANYHTVGSFKRSSVVAVCTKNNNWCKIQQKSCWLGTIRKACRDLEMPLYSA